MDFIETYVAAIWEMVAEMAPYLLLGFAIAGLLHRYIRQSWIERRLGKRSLKSIITASLVGVPMPLCSCGVVPVAASLRDRGASKGATASFLTSTPQTGVDSIAATYGLMGATFALYRIVVAFISGIIVGVIIDKTDPVKTPHTAAASTNQDKIPTWQASLKYAFRDLPQDISSHLIIGFLLAGLITALAPKDLLAQIPGGVFSSILLTTVIAVPLYICSTGSIPLAIALIHSGLPISSALVLLIAGPATNAATIATLKKILGGKETTIYVACIILTSWVSAYIFHLFFDQTALSAIDHLHAHPVTLFQIVCSIALVALLAQTYLPQFSKINRQTPHDNTMQSFTLTVKGMNCSHCQRSVEQGLASLPNIESVTVDLKAASVSVQGTEIDQSQIVSKITDLGFDPQTD